ncbi:hypothetical protein J9303_14660 [Bacillaceae bacterium Marseille-Q3522]|nr:hypothetical protein [Bacillaceae bacterium Marseille-Q3522]
MRTKLASEKVAHMLNEWYGLIRQEKLREATAMKENIANVLPIMEENQDLLLYFSLLDFRYNLIKEDFTTSTQLFKNIEKKTSEVYKTDDMIQYYFYFFSGMYEFHRKNYTGAINYYKIAEERIKLIPDEIEHAEFHYKLSIAYYQIKQNFLSLSHAEKALFIFRKNPNYFEKCISCELIFGANKFDLLRFDEANRHYENALKTATIQNKPEFIGKAHHNIGLGNFCKKEWLLAESHFRKALQVHEHYQSSSGTRSMYMLTNVLYKNENIEEARFWYYETLNRVEEAKEVEYFAKLSLIHALYDAGDWLEIDRALRYLEEKRLWIDVEDLSLDIAEYLRRQHDYERVTYYLDKVIYAKNQIQKLSEELK